MNPKRKSRTTEFPGSDAGISRRSFLCASIAAMATPALPGFGFSVPAPGRTELPFRQVHLDFHTSELIPDVGADFDPQDFLRVLQAAHVNSINVFAKCHHGYLYYDTRIGIKHPSLKRDLLGEMLQTCRPAGIAVNYYYSLVWDVLQSRQHPEWRMLDRKGNPIGGPPSVSWPWMCINSPYFVRVLAENREILNKYDSDGGWFDILKLPDDGCFCQWCRADRTKLGLSDSPQDIYQHNKTVATRAEKQLSELIHERFPRALVFFNSRIVIGLRDELPYYSDIEIESLPTGGWGYSHFQQRIRYMRTLGKECVGMTGRFHKSWGDFGGLKNQAALDFECLNFIANGAKACIGDQLHPRGRLDPTTYLRIGATYRKLEALEPWTRRAKAVTDIGVISVAATNPDMTTRKVPEVDQGFTNMLLELHHQFDVLDVASDFERYKLVIVPDEIRPSAELTAKLKRFLSNGGSLIVSHESLLDAAQRNFTLDAMGVRYQGPAKYKGEFMLLKRDTFPEIDEEAYFLYQPGFSITANQGTEVLATYGHPYFDRAPEHFMSHRQTAFNQRTDEPLITRREKVVYIANPFFRSYSQDAYGVQKQVIAGLLRLLLPQPAVMTANVPSTAQVTVLEQGPRCIVHVLYYPLTRRAPDIDIIEEAGSLENVVLKLRCHGKPARVALVPENRELPFEYTDGYAVCTVPRVVGHQAVVFE